jgi:hypothetical protein
MTPRTIRFGNALLAELAEYAEETQTEQAEVVRLALEAFLEGGLEQWHAKYLLERDARIAAQQQLIRVREAARLLQQAPAFAKVLREVA